VINKAAKEKPPLKGVETKARFRYFDFPPKEGLQKSKRLSRFSDFKEKTQTRIR